MCAMLGIIANFVYVTLIMNRFMIKLLNMKEVIVNQSLRSTKYAYAIFFYYC